jgi:sn-glycerol 3-phosphate transport system substrate-binding protein
MKRRNVKRLVVACLAIAMMVVCAGPIAAKPAKIKLNYWHFLGGDIGKRHEQFVGEFNKAHSNIEVVPLYSGTAWTMRDKLLVSVAGKQPPDISMIDQFWAAQLTSTGSLVRMETLMDGPDGVDKDDIDRIALATATVDGEIWTMPYAMSNIYTTGWGMARPKNPST